MSKRLDQINEIYDASAGYLHAIIPDILSPTGYTSYKIKRENLVKGTTGNPIVVTNQSTSFQVTYPANCKIEDIIIKMQSGTTDIKIGNTPNGSDIWDLETFTGDTEIKVEEYYETSGIIYFTVSGSNAFDCIILLTLLP